MTEYRTLKIKPGAPALPDPSAVPLQATSPLVAHQAIKALDTLPGSVARVWGRFGLQGGHKFLIPNGDNPTSGLTRIYPDKSTPRVVMRSKGTLQAGHFIGIDILALPSGPSQKEDIDGTFIPDGAGGSVTLSVTYTNSDAQTITCAAEVGLPASVELYAAEPANAYGSMIGGKAVAQPTPLQPTAEHWQKWTRGLDVKFEATVAYVGSPRVIDGMIIEVPNIIVVDNADSRWPTAMYTASGDAYVQPPSEYPIEQKTSTDPGGGTQSIHRALYDHGRQYGPVLIAWTCATEHIGDLDDWISYDAGTGDDEAPPATMTGTTPTQLPWGATTKSASNPGWSVSSYARQVDAGDHFLDGRTGVMKVFVHLYCRVSGGAGRFDLRTDEVGWDTVRAKPTNTAWGWVTAFGRLEVGAGPEAGRLARLWVSNSGANDCDIRYLIVEHAAV